jgi:RNA polymerase sigma factor (TIGR02999 family)
VEEDNLPREEFDRLFSLAYEELRRLAARVRRHEVAQTLNATALVNEVYLKLLPSLKLRPDSEVHFKRIVVRAMRQVLVEAARRRRALKRGGDQIFVTLEDVFEDTAADAEEILALDDALEELARANPRQAQLVEYRFFGGFELREISALLEVSESTVDRDLRAVKAWLTVRMKHRQQENV